MSLQTLNDENFLVDLTAESCDFLFTPPEPTGRPSILRASQKENLPPKSAGKSMKVTFQTPMRDPQTRRIMSPSTVTKPESLFSLDDCTQALEQLHLSAANTSSLNPEVPTVSSTTDSSACPEEDAPVRSLGAYSIDFDNLDAFNPFMSTKMMQNSPVKDFPESVADSGVHSAPEAVADAAEISIQGLEALRASEISESPVTVQFGCSADACNTSGKSSLDDTVPLTSDVAEVSSVSEAAVEGDKMEALEKELCPNTDQPGQEPRSTALVTEAAPAIVDEAPKPEVPSSPPVPKATYSFDPDQLDSIDPFNTGGSKLQNSPKKTVSEENGGKAEPVKLEFDFGGGDAPPRKPPPKKLGKRPPLKTGPKKPAVTKEAVPETPKQQEPSKPPEEDVLVPKAAYNFDWDKFDDPNFNPFGCGGSKIGASPKVANSTITEQSPTQVENTTDLPLEEKLEANKSTVVEPAKAIEKVGFGSLDWSGCSLREEGEMFEGSDDFDVGVDAEQGQGDSSDISGVLAHMFGVLAFSPTVVAPPLKGEFFFEDTIQEAPKAEETPASVSIQESSRADRVEDTNAVVEQVSPVLDEMAVQSCTELIDSKDDLSNRQTSLAAGFGSDLEMEFRPAEEVDFMPATEFEGFSQPIEIDYLEKFGSTSFKESALRKQSLYLKFDPLLSQSPKKSTVSDGDLMCGLPLHSSADLFGALPEPPFKVTPTLETEEKPKGLDLLGTFTVADTAPLIPETGCLVSAPDPFLLPYDVGAIVEVLKYSQKDMDAAIEAVRQEVQEKELEVLEWKNKHEKLFLEYAEMRKIIAEYENTIAQILEDAQRQKEMGKIELNKVLQEKQQVQNDLNSMEKSFSDLFKRLEKQKEVLEGYRKNEEALKKCVEEYLVRIKKEEQRYQALKAHAEEKLNRANEEIAQVRSKAKAEATALQATLRKEQMKTQSLERTLEQKAKENDELTKICDDLILKMEKI
ncbi:transforming acidic coiled-coil-containing protein 3 [Gastrophryne carolinensis]